MESGGNWAVVLAGGDGVRLQQLTWRLASDGRPKQFCRLLDEHTLLGATRARLKHPRARAWALPSHDEAFVGFRTCAI